MANSIRIEGRYNGPPDSAHGGFSCGLFASLVNGRAATVRLLAPPPLDVDLTANSTESGVVISGPHGDVAQVRPIAEDLSFGTLPWLSDDQVSAARLHWQQHTKPILAFSTCFACGHDRPNDDGLALRPGEVPDSDLGVAVWTPENSRSGEVADSDVWTALDCPSGSVIFRYISEGLTVLLGEFTVRIDQTPVVGERYQVVARRLGVEGRRLMTEVGLVASDGRNLASGRATWILVPLNTD